MPLLAEPDDFYGGRGASRSRTYRMLPCQRAFGHESGEARRTRRSRASRLGFPGTVERRGSETTLVSASPVLESPRVAPGPARAETVSAAAATAGRLYEEHYERVFGYCLYKLGMRQEAEDAAQTTFLWALRSLEAGIDWARNGREAVQLVRQVLPDLALVSVDTPPVDGLAVTRELLAANPTCKVIVFGPDGSPLEIERALLAGAAGYVTLDPVGIDLIALAIDAQEAHFGASERRSSGSLAEPAYPSGKRNLRRL